MSGKNQGFVQEINLDDLKRTPRRFKFEPNAAERVEIAKRLGVPAVDALTGQMTVTGRGEEFSVAGELKAALRRECVASLEETDEAVEDAFEIEFTRRPAPEPSDEDEPVSLDGPEHHEGDALDLADLLVQQLSLAMDPFPRKQGAANLLDQYGAAEERSAFAEALATARKAEEKQ